jgi:hypothetical protein
MAVSPEALAELQQVCPGAALRTEAGQHYIDLPGLKICVGSDVAVRDALLTLQNHSGYPSRLFVSQPISGRGMNWTNHCVLGRSWHSPSWGSVPPSRPIEMLLQHLKVYR